MNKARSLQRPPIHTPKLYEQETAGKDAIVYAHYFFPGTKIDWYVLEFDEESDVIFGWAEILPDCGEYGYTHLAEIEEVKRQVEIRINGQSTGMSFSVGVEYDLYWQEKSIGEVLSNR